jgi:hypothetical protein
MDENNQNFKIGVLEADIERLSREIKEKKELLENKGVSNKELLKQTLGPIVKQTGRIQPTQTNIQPADDNKFLSDYLKDAPADVKIKVEKLIDSAFRHGLSGAVNEARRFDPFILDAFHDTLTDKLYDELKKRGLL